MAIFSYSFVANLFFSSVLRGRRPISARPEMGERDAEGGRESRCGAGSFSLWTYSSPRTLIAFSLIYPRRSHRSARGLRLAPLTRSQTLRCPLLQEGAALSRKRHSIYKESATASARASGRVRIRERTVPVNEKEMELYALSVRKRESKGRTAPQGDSPLGASFAYFSSRDEK